jgi:tRNA(Ile2) C34 agmatinyltransferase TiaS
MINDVLEAEMTPVTEKPRMRQCGTSKGRNGYVCRNSGIINSKENRRNSEKNLLLGHFIHHESGTKSPGIEPEAPLQKVST